MIPRPGFRPCKGTAERSAGDSTAMRIPEIASSHGYDIWLQLLNPGCWHTFFEQLRFLPAQDLTVGRQVVCVRAEDINISGSLYRNKLKYANFRRKHMQLGCISDVNCIYSSNCQIRRQEAKGFQLSSPCQPEEHQSSSRTLPLSISCQDPVAHHPRHGDHPKCMI